jgi:hypothetical protein
LTLGTHVVSEVATAIGAVPISRLGILRFKGKACDRAWWWLACAFLVSWMADNATRWTGHPMVSVTYPLLQAGIIVSVFLFRGDAIKMVIVLMMAGVADILWNGVQSPDILLRTVAWLSVVGVIYPLGQLGRLRASLLVYFGIGWACWMLYVAWPGWTSWSLYQLSRLVGIILFCWAASHPEPHLKLTKV